ncbi:hypothetical protein DD594_27815, partial [Enterobacter cloacae complex sp. 4DZ1-17B1]
VTDTRWPEIDTIELIARQLNASFTWIDCPVECALTFRSKFQMLMSKYILAKGVLGRVQHHLVRYEVQNRGSLHAHVILWMHEEDKEKLSAELAAYISTETSSVVLPAVSRLRELVLRKQLHKFRTSYYHCQRDGV